jgi:hypothetical protein
MRVVKDDKDFLNEPTDADEDPTLPGRRPISLSFTRGMNPRAVTSWVRHTHGPEAVAKLAAVLPDDVKDDLGGDKLKPMPTAWVPYQSYVKFLTALDLLFGKGDLKLLRKVGHYQAFHDFPAIARPLARLLSPGWLVDVSTRIWSVYNSHGRWEISRGERQVRGILLDTLECDPAFCMSMCGWVEGALMYCGATDASCIEERCVSRGDPYCSVNATWLEKRDMARTRIPRAPL